MRKKDTAALRKGLRALLLAGLLCAGHAALASDARPLTLRHLTTANGLPQATVMTTLRDSRGFVWIGTEDGLMRFDGQQMVRYSRSQEGARSLPGNFIRQVVEDPNHDLWVAVKDAGLARWHRDTDRFETWSHDPERSDSLSSNAVRALVVDRTGQVWVATTDAGISILDPATGRFRHLRHDPESLDSLGSDEVYTLLLDRSGDVWIGTAAGLDRWDADSGQIVRVRMRDTAGRAIRVQVTQLLQDKNDSLWVGTFDAGLMRVERDGRLRERYTHRPGVASSLASNDVRALLRDASGNLWVGTDDGLDLLTSDSNRFIHYRRDGGDAESLRDSFIMSLYQDDSGLVWIGTRSGGVSRWSPRSWEMGGIRPGWLRDQAVFAFADAPGSDVWVASLAGLFRYDSHTGGARNIDEVLGRRNVLGDRRVTALRSARDGSLWIGMMADGLKRLRPDGRLQSFPVAQRRAGAISSGGVMSIAEARDGRIWVGTFGGGLNIIDPSAGAVRQLPYGSEKGAISGGVVTAILEDAQGRFWLGTDGTGVSVVDAKGALLRQFRHAQADLQSLPSDTVYALSLDKAGRVWIGTSSGIAWVVNAGAQPGDLQLSAVTSSRGGSEVAYGLISDAQGGMWISGNAGLLYLDPDSGAMRAYHREDGLQGEEFSFGAYYRLRDGRIAFGGPGGFNIFDPRRQNELRRPPELLLTHIDVLGVPAGGDAPFWTRRTLALDHRASIVSLDFAVLDYATPEHSRLSYRLPGLSDQWIDLGAQRRVTLTNLQAGNHVLEVRAAGADSPWSAEPLRFTIHRDPAPWRTPWAYALYVTLLGGLVTLRVVREHHKLRAMQSTQEYLESQVAARTVELVDSNQRLAEAARAKSDFLDRMSHELRTPMNGVVGMTELLSRTVLTPAQSQLTRTISASAHILLRIVNDLLDLSKIRAGKVELERSPIDLCQMLEECASLFAAAADAKGLKLVVCPPAQWRRALLGDPLRLRQILMNLIGNALKFTASGEIVVRADVEPAGQDQATVRLSVTDTGIGIEESVLSRVFDPFTQADEKTTRQYGGTGLGLSICRELAALMSGEICVKSRPQVGSTFSLQLPMPIGETLECGAVLPAMPVQICTHSPALAESLQRFCATLGLAQIGYDASIGDAHVVQIVDASTDAGRLSGLLAGAVEDRARLVVIATAQEVETLGLRVLLREGLVVTRPVLRQSLREAFATATGTGSGAGHRTPAIEPLARLHGSVLVVEDDPVNAAVAEGYLAEIGCRCTAVSSATAAISLAQTQRFDLVLMDLNMPDMDGLTATSRLREAEAQRGDARTPIIALTAHEAHSHRERVLRAGMDDILSKPCTLQDFHALLAHWMSGRQLPATAAVAEVRLPADAALAVVDVGAVQVIARMGTGGSSGLFQKLVSLFETSSRPLVRALADAVAERRFDAAAGICHRLKSSSANVGAIAFSAALRELEQQCRSGEGDTVQAACLQIVQAHEPLLEALHGFKWAASA